jgi:hypothetical protein
MSDGGKVAASAVIVMVLAIAALVDAAISKPVPVPRPCTDAATRDKLKALALEGFEAALKEHVKTIFDVFLRDSSNTTQRAKAGLQNAAAAYIHSRTVVMAWDLPECKP